MDRHRAKIHFHKYNGKHHYDSQQSIIVVRNSPDKDRKSVFSFYESADCRRPGGHRRDNTDRSRRGVDKIRQLGLGNIVLICDRPHNASHSKAVKIIIYKNQDPQDDRSDLGSDPGLDMDACPSSESCRTSRTIHHRDHGSQDHQEDQDPHIIGICQNTDKALLY